MSEPLSICDYSRRSKTADDVLPIRDIFGRKSSEEALAGLAEHTRDFKYQIKEKRSERNTGLTAQGFPSADHLLPHDEMQSRASKNRSFPDRQAELETTGNFEIPVPNYKSQLLPPVSLRIGPEDGYQIEKKYRELLKAHHDNSLSKDEQSKLHTLAIANLCIDKYCSALQTQELKICGAMPPSLRGPFLASQALQDGATIGAIKSVLDKVIEGGALGDLSSGVAMGVALGKLVGKLACNINPWVRGTAMLIQAGGIAMAAEQINKIGHEGWCGCLNCMPALQDVCANPCATTLDNATKKVVKELGPVLADATLTAIGFAAAEGLNKATCKLGSEARTDSSCKAKETAIEKAEPELAGIKGKPPWEIYNSQESPAVVKQFHDESCLSAVGEMLTDGKVTQADLINKLGTWKVSPMKLAAELGDEWECEYVMNPLAKLDSLVHNGPFGATLKKYGYGSHGVVVDGETGAGRIMVRDTGEGLKYEIDRQEFLDLFESAIYKRKA